MLALTQKVLERFGKFADSYVRGADIKESEGYLLKKQHTIRVLGKVDEILLRSPTIDNETKLVIELTAILHDIGRFPEWKNTRSFSGILGVDHCEIGAIMLENGMIKKFIPEERKYDSIIILAVREHGKITLPENLSKQQLTVCQVIRDADRLDIFYECANELTFDILYRSRKLGNKKLSEEVRKKLIAGEPMQFDIINSKLDMLALRIGLIKQLSTVASMRYVSDSNIANKMIDFFEDKYPYYDREEVEWIREEINRYLGKTKT